MAENTNTAHDAFEVWANKEMPCLDLKRSGDTYYAGETRDYFDPFVAGRASLSLPAAGQEPVAWLHTDRLGGKQAFTNEPPPSLKAKCLPLYAHQQPAVAAGREQIAEAALLKVLTAVQRYLPPDGPSAKDTLSEIIEIVDPWPLGPLEKP